MKPHVRRAIAYIAACIISGKRPSTVYDLTSSQYYNFSINLSESGIAAFDYTQSSHISGSYSSLYHYGEGHHISLRIEGGRFSGFDYGESSNFSGSVNGNSVSLYDYGVGSYFNFSI
jgi:hypothetical protein